MSQRCAIAPQTLKQQPSEEEGFLWEEFRSNSSRQEEGSQGPSDLVRQQSDSRRMVLAEAQFLENCSRSTVTLIPLLCSFTPGSGPVHTGFCKISRGSLEGQDYLLFSTACPKIFT